MAVKKTKAAAKRAKTRKRAAKKVARKKSARKALAASKTGSVRITGHPAHIRIGRTVSVATANQIYDTLDISKETIRAAQRAVR